MFGFFGSHLRRRVELLGGGDVARLNCIHPVLPAGSPAGGIQEPLLLLLLLGLGDLTSQVKKPVSIGLILPVGTHRPILGVVGFIKAKPANLTVHEMTHNLIPVSYTHLTLPTKRIV